MKNKEYKIKNKIENKEDKENNLSALQQALINLPHHIFFSFMFVFNWYFISQSITKNEWSVVLLVFMIIQLCWMISTLSLFDIYWLYLLENKNNKEKKQEIIWFWLVIFLFVSLIFIILNIFILLPLTYFLFDKDVFHLILIWLPITFLINSISFIDITNKYIWKIHYNIIFKWGHLISMIIFTVLLYYLWFLNINTIMYMNYIVIWTFFLPYFFVWKPKFNNTKKHFKEFKEFIKHWINVYIIRIFIKLSVLIDKIILWIYVLPQIIIMKIWNMFFMPINLFWEDFWKAKITDFKEWKNINKKIFFYIILIYIIYWTLFYFFAGYLINYIYWQKYTDVINYTIFFILNWIILNHISIFYNYLHIHNKIAKDMKYKVIYRFIVNLILSLILIPLFWIIWAFISLISSRLFILIEYYLIYKKKEK